MFSPKSCADIGVTVDHPAPNVYEIASADAEWLFVPLEAAAKMRASFILLGPLLARFGRVIISNPGGDRIGRRPVNLHVDAMRALGAEIDYRNGYYFAKAPGRLRGGPITFPQITVMGTENAMLAAVLADGHTVIEPAAQEPEVDDLIAFLQKMGARDRAYGAAPDRDRGPPAHARRRSLGRARSDRGRHLHRRGRRDARPDHPSRRRDRPSGRFPQRHGPGRRLGDLHRRQDRGRRHLGRSRVPAVSRHRDASPTPAWPRTSSHPRASF